MASGKEALILIAGLGALTDGVTNWYSSWCKGKIALLDGYSVLLLMVFSGGGDGDCFSVSVMLMRCGREILNPNTLYPAFTVANQENQQPISEEERPLILAHRISTFKLSRQPTFEERLLDHPFDSLEQTQSFLSRHAASIRVVINVGRTPISAEFLHLLPRLELIVSTSSGLDRIDLPECRCWFVCGGLWPVKKDYAPGFKDLLGWPSR
ncbi:hypothetical protein SLEP1_g8753 [Rubroshorea leprosula]|uniref:D-isomer specific 2-hydroxyacid dehydrogenase catalytic domain-containing protein n=1 Tax=Rubroshorea leprosula TaxID=152421 RepID=A0AAV5I8M3_9ROSI|nr:hypothetical protein SLEP1_g8753 [Rubroshorea leprosula]